MRTLSEIESAREAALDRALEATFPASDPLSVTQPGGFDDAAPPGAAVDAALGR
jgi:hypothetical protein